MTLSALAGRVQVVPGADRPLVCTRPAAHASWLRRLVVGRAAADVPGLLATVFSLCGGLHRFTARRALLAASGATLSPVLQRDEQAWLRAACLREHVLWLGLLPAAEAALTAELRGLLHALPALSSTEPALDDRTRQLRAILHERVLGMPAERWVQSYASGASAAVAAWAADARAGLPVAAWFRQAQASACALTLPLSAATPLDGGRSQLHQLATSLREDDGFAEHAHCAGLPAETGAFNRAARPVSQRQCRHAYDVLTARVLDAAQLAVTENWLGSGAIALGPGEAVAYTEIARGLLVHWVKLATPLPAPEAARIVDYRVVTPTDFCLHPEGALARRLRTPTLTRSDVELLLAAFDPCVEIALAPAPEEREDSRA